MAQEDGENMDMKIHIWLCDLALGINIIYVLETRLLLISFYYEAFSFGGLNGGWDTLHFLQNFGCALSFVPKSVLFL